MTEAMPSRSVSAAAVDSGDAAQTASGGKRKRKRHHAAAEDGTEEAPKRAPPQQEESDDNALSAPAAEAEDGGAVESADAGAAGARRRYIVFVGNLPYRVSVGDVERLFSAMRPVGCRLPTDKDNRKPKGYAFVEFDDATCMRVRHTDKQPASNALPAHSHPHPH